jgi:hypothetical protein
VSLSDFFKTNTSSDYFNFQRPQSWVIHLLTDELSPNMSAHWIANDG